MDENFIKENDEEISIKKKNKKENEKIWKVFVDYIKVIIIALIISFAIKTFVVTTTVVDGRSMNPTVNDKDRLVVNKIFFMKKNITRGDIIDFYVPEAKKYYLKRVIGVEGDIVEIKDNRLYLNGKMQNEPYVSTNVTSPHNQTTKWQVPKGYIFVLGDNRSNSRDGRDLGVVSRENIVGKIIFRFYPFNNFGGLN